MKKNSAAREKILKAFMKAFIISDLNFKEYFDDINVVMDFSEVKDQEILTTLMGQLINLKKYLPNLHASIKNLALKAVSEHDCITIAFNNSEIKFGTPACWIKAKKTINIDYNLKHFALIYAIGFELCNANNKELNSFNENISTTEYIYDNPELFFEDMHKLAIKCLETEYLSHKELKQIFDNYYLQEPNIKEIRREAATEIIDYTQHYKMSTKEEKQCISFLRLKGGDVKGFVDAHPGHIEKYKNQIAMFVLYNVNKHHQDILSSLEYSTATEKIDEGINTSCDPANRVELNKHKGHLGLPKLKIAFLIYLFEEKSQGDETTDIWCVIGNNSEYIKTCDADSLQAIGDSYHDHL